MLYTAFTHYLGFSSNDEYKVMGLSAYGKPVFKDKINSSGDDLVELLGVQGLKELNKEPIQVFNSLPIDVKTAIIKQWKI